MNINILIEKIVSDFLCIKTTCEQCLAGLRDGRSGVCLITEMDRNEPKHRNGAIEY